MQVERVHWDGQPERITREKFDCVWIAFTPRDVPSPPKRQVLQWIDWKLQGQLSRYLIENVKEGVTFVPTMKKLPSPYLALQWGAELDWERFRKSCEGLKIRRVLYFCEDDAMLSGVEKTIRAAASGGYPETVSLGTDA